MRGGKKNEVGAKKQQSENKKKTSVIYMHIAQLISTN